MRTDSIRVRMTVILTLATAVLMLLVCGGLVVYSRQVAEHNATELLQATVRQIAADLKEGGDSEQGSTPMEVIKESRSRFEANDLAFTVADLNGRILLRSQQTSPPSRALGSPGWRVASLRAQGDVIVIGVPWAETEETLKREAGVLAALGLFVTLLSAVGAWWLVGRTLSPIHRLSQQVNGAPADSLRLRLAPSSGDVEIVELVGTINSLLERIGHAAAMRSRFYAAASHELRTPLYVLVGSLEVALGKERSREEYRDALQVAETQARQLSLLVRDLLSLNQLDFVPTPPPAENIDLPDLVCSTLVSFQRLSGSKRLSIETDLPADGRADAPPAHLEMLTRNLIENAIKYTPEGGTVSIRVAREGSGMALTITNEYPPFPRLDCDQLFEPFYRPDASRNVQSGGNGLGLAICKAIAAVNGWSLMLKQSGRQVRVEVLVRTRRASTCVAGNEKDKT